MEIKIKEKIIKSDSKRRVIILSDNNLFTEDGKRGKEEAFTSISSLCKRMSFPKESNGEIGYKLRKNKDVCIYSGYYIRRIKLF